MLPPPHPPGTTHGLRPRPSALPARPFALTALALLATQAGAPAQAQDGGTAAATSLTPTLNITQTFTDNARFGAGTSSSAGGARQAESITQISPGLSLSSRSGRVTGSLSYAANALVFARQSDASTVQHQLAATGSAQLLERYLAVDAQASVGQQAISAFGASTSTPQADRSNRTEVSSYSIAPRLSGRLLGQVDVQARLGYTVTRSDATAAGDVEGLLASVAFSGALGRIGWGLDLSRSMNEGQQARRLYSSRAVARAGWSPVPDWNLTLRAGRETDNLRSAASDASTTFGGGATWVPSPRTTVALEADKRYFGHSHTLSVQHRLARSSVSYSDTRSLNAGGAVGGARFSAYDLFFAQFASQVPDPLQRDLFVRNYLRSLGIDPSTVISGGFVTSAATVTRSQLLSLGWSGQRSTVTLGLSRSQSARVGTAGGAGGDLDQTDEVRQTGLTVAASYRLTPTAAMNLAGSLQRSSGGARQGGTETRNITAGWQGTLGPRSTLSLGLRWAEFQSEAEPTHETSLYGTLSMRF